jgi:hypothetical protein
MTDLIPDKARAYIRFSATVEDAVAELEGIR